MHPVLTLFANIRTRASRNSSDSTILPYARARSNMVNVVFVYEDRTMQAHAVPFTKINTGILHVYKVEQCNIRILMQIKWYSGKEMFMLYLGFACNLGLFLCGNLYFANIFQIYTKFIVKKKSKHTKVLFRKIRQQNKPRTTKIRKSLKKEEPKSLH